LRRKAEKRKAVCNLFLTGRSPCRRGAEQFGNLRKACQFVGGKRTEEIFFFCFFFLFAVWKRPFLLVLARKSFKNGV
jgi:hypothetical protein